MACNYKMEIIHVNQDGEQVDEFVLNGPHDGRRIASPGSVIVKFEHLDSDDPNIVKTRLTLTDESDELGS